MKYIPIDDEQAELVERAARMGKVSELVGLLKLVEEKQLSIEQLIEDIKAAKTFEWEPRVKEIENKLLKLDSRAKEIDSILSAETDQWEGKRDYCEHYDGTKCTFWSYEEKPSELKTIKDGEVWRVLVKEQPEYCAPCPDFKDKREPSVDDRLLVATAHGEWKRDHCVHYDETKCTYWSYGKPPKYIKPVKDKRGDKVRWRVKVKEQPEYCVSCPAFKSKEDKK